MDRLQKLYDAGISFQINYEPKLNKKVFWLLRIYDQHGHHTYECGYATVENCVANLWQAAKRVYPTAECFDEEGGE